MTIYRGYDITKTDAGYSWRDANSGFFSGYFKTEDQAMDNIDAMKRKALAGEKPAA